MLAHLLQSVHRVYSQYFQMGFRCDKEVISSIKGVLWIQCQYFKTFYPYVHSYPLNTAKGKASMSDIPLKLTMEGAKEMAHWLRASPAVPEDPDLIRRTHRDVHNHV